ncbi:MAG: class I mannose-6-phosphate isomerase [Muribaculaceae bacterium]|nr:class I mannose-6-phosphate isomerase [Muribaculaceae bacterium]
MNKIFTFKPILKTVVWGGDKIKKFKNIDTDMENIGESWEISGVPGHESVVDSGEDAGLTITQLIDRYGADLVGEDVYRRFGHDFPLLIKIIDARDNLSVQVHPDDELARLRHNSQGKTEMWYVIDADYDAAITAGLSKEITPDEYRRRIADNSIADVLASHRSHPGDVFFLPAGRIHAIGAGNLIAEIQQTSDITYRVYDYDRRGLDGKPRQLHVEEAVDAIDYKVYDNYVTDYDRNATGEVPLVGCRYFDVQKITVDGQTSLHHLSESFAVLICISGQCTIDIDQEAASSISRGNTALIAASARAVTLTGNAVLITASVPRQ